MKIPKLSKPGFYGAIAGATLLAINGFSWGGWVTGSKAQEMAAEAAVVALVPVCIAQSDQDPQFDTQIRRLRNAQPYMRQDLVSEMGWATVPGTSEPNHRLASACGKKLVVMH